ncbi:MAG: 3-isopropylmalate dehydrogenase [Desulfovibrio sp.]|nr:3-isopropylmalate dehydrogenase [Desulfovibrio sp.]
MNKTICLLPGDGIGPEILAQGVACIKAVIERFNCAIDFSEALIGGAAIDAGGDPLPRKTIDACLAADAVYLGAVGGPKWDGLPMDKRPEKGLLGIRKALDLFANLRPATLWPELAKACLLRPDIAARGLDLVVVRELTGDIYFGQPRGIEERDGVRTGFNTMIYDENEIERIAKIAFDLAMTRRKIVCSIDKSNVLEASRLWREKVIEVARRYPEVRLTHMYVDNAAMQLVRDPSQFDVILTGNIFGDILSDESAAITGSLGMLPSASLGEKNPGLFEPIHGSAPDIAGQDKANPLATIISGAMLLETGLKMPAEAAAILKAVSETLKAGYRTADIMEDGKKLVGCREMGAEVVKRIKQA